MKILGMGILFSGGRGLDAFEQALTGGPGRPDLVTVGKSSVPAMLVDFDRVQDKSLFKKMRRSDKLSKMAVLAAADAVQDSGLSNGDLKKIGVIVSTAFGAHVTTFEFIDDILRYGDGAVSPTLFSNSVHNAAASYISMVLGIQGPTLTVTRFFFSFQSALQLAGAWLDEGRLEHVLVGSVDEFGDVMGYIGQNRLNLAEDGQMRPESGTAVPGEGAAFFVVSRSAPGRPCCSVPEIAFGSGPCNPSAAFSILDADGMIPDQSAYHRILQEGRSAVYAPVYGSMMGGSAFSVAAAALMVKTQTVFPDPVPWLKRDQAQGLKPSGPLESVRCIRYDCSGSWSSIIVSKID